MRAEFQKELEDTKMILEKNHIEMAQKAKANDAKLKQSAAPAKMSKKRREKLDKIKANVNLDEAQKEAMIAAINEDAEHRKIKRSKLDNYKEEGYIEAERAITTENQKANASALWGDAEKAYLDDVTLNMIPDEEAVKHMKGKTAMRWDNVKKRYMLKKVDREGRVIAERRNESGAKITNKNKEKKQGEIFKTWQQRTHLNLPKTGDMEDPKAIEQAKRANETRKFSKDFKRRHGAELFKGTDARDNKTMIDKKRAKMFAKASNNKEKNRKSPMG